MNRLEAMINRDTVEPITQRQIKTEERQTLAQQIDDFFQRGGEMEVVPFGKSGEEFIAKRTIEQSRDMVRQESYKRNQK